MTRSPARVPLPPHPPALARRWCATAAAEALAAIVLLAVHTNRLIIAAGVLAAAAAATALATAWLRSRQASSADITAIIAVTLILAVPPARAPSLSPMPAGTARAGTPGHRVFPAGRVLSSPGT